MESVLNKKNVLSLVIKNLNFLKKHLPRFEV